MARPTGRPVKEEILIATRTLIQRVGVCGFSYGDLAKELGIKAPSIHHHFRTKEELVAEVARRYRLDFGDRVAKLQDDSATRRIERYVDIFEQTAASDLLCLCGAVAAEWATVGELPKAEVENFFDEQEAWLAEAVRFGVTSGEFRSDLDPEETARTMLATLEGAILMTRAGPRPGLASGVGAVLTRLLTPVG